MDQRDQDRLARHGQTVVKGWLERNYLLPQSPDHDRLGWDFFAEFQPEIREDVPLDSQGDLKKALIQVKSTTNAGSTVSGKLSALKALADSDLPAFITALEFDGALNLQRARLLHIGEDEIELILRRTRELESQGRFDLHNSKISLSMHSAYEIDDCGSNLAECILSAVGARTSDYISKKAKFRQTCGFGEGSHTATIKWSSGSKNLVDLVLGYSSELPIDTFEIKHKRFDIPLDSDTKQISGGILRIDAIAARREQITIRNGNDRASLDFDFYTPGIPNLPPALQYCRLKNEFLDVKLHLGELKLNIDFKLPFSGAHRIEPLSRLLKFIYFLSLEDREIVIGSGEHALITPAGSPASQFAEYRELWQFADFISSLLYKHYPENKNLTNLEELWRIYWSQRGQFALINSSGFADSIRMERHALPDSETREIVMFCPANLTIFDAQYGAVFQISCRNLSRDNKYITLSNSTAVKAYEIFAFDKASDSLRSDLEIKARELASACNYFDEFTFVRYVAFNKDGTVNLLDPRETQGHPEEHRASGSS